MKGVAPSSYCQNRQFIPSIYLILLRKCRKCDKNGIEKDRIYMNSTVISYLILKIMDKNAKKCYYYSVWIFRYLRLLK